MKNISDFNQIKVKNNIIKVAKRNGMSKYELARLKRIDESVFVNISKENMMDFEKKTRRFFSKLQELKANELELKDIAIYAYTMVLFTRTVLERYCADNYSEEDARALEILLDYQNESKYLFLETNIFFKILDYMEYEEI